jgi:hypothetical protein
MSLSDPHVTWARPPRRKLSSACIEVLEDLHSQVYCLVGRVQVKGVALVAIVVEGCLG